MAAHFQPHIAAANTAMPTFSTSDATQYVSTHPIFRARTKGKQSPFNIASITSRELTVKLGGESTELPDDALVCIVEATGNVTFSGPQGTEFTFAHVFEVFDGRTGNFLMAGGRN